MVHPAVGIARNDSGRTSPWSAGIGLAGEKLENLFSARLMSHFSRQGGVSSASQTVGLPGIYGRPSLN